MVTDSEFIYVNLYGEAVAPDDPTAQTKFAPAELKVLREGGFFAKRAGQAATVADESAGTPVLTSGVGAADDAAADVPTHAASAKHGKR